MSTLPIVSTDRKSLPEMRQTQPPAEAPFHLEALPTELALRILKEAHNPLASGVCRSWRILNLTAINALWNHMQPILLEDPLLASYIQCMHFEDSSDSGKTKFRELIQAIRNDLQDVPALSELSNISPCLLRAFQALSTLAKDVSLQRLWEGFLEGSDLRQSYKLFARSLIDLADYEHLLRLPAQEIREWIWNLSEGITDRVREIPRSKNLFVIPDEIKRYRHVQRLFFSGNKIRCLSSDSFQGMSHLTRLELASNQIQSLPEDVFRSLSSLKDLDLKENHIALLPPRLLQHLTHLESLDLSDNEIAEIPEQSFDALQELKGLYLTHNRIAFLSVGLFKHLGNLRTLDLDGNQIKCLPPALFLSLSRLDHLHLADNCIEELSSASFQGLVELSSLNLRNNQIRSLPEHCFRGLSQLHVVCLEGNPIPVVPPIEELKSPARATENGVGREERGRSAPDRVWVRQNRSSSPDLSAK